jgi:hypothetical protein
METDNTRILFTNHRLHMNNLGKQLVNCQIATFLYSISEPKKSPISLGWYEPENCNHHIQEDNQIISVSRNSSRSKKLPVTRSNDFYGTFENYKTDKY